MKSEFSLCKHTFSASTSLGRLVCYIFLISPISLWQRRQERRREQVMIVLSEPEDNFAVALEKLALRNRHRRNIFFFFFYVVLCFQTANSRFYTATNNTSGRIIHLKYSSDSINTVDARKIIRPFCRHSKNGDGRIFETL